MKDMLDGKEIVKELREVIDCIANEELKTATRMALTIIEKLTPKTLFKVGPAKLRNGMDFKIYEIYIDRIHGAFKTTCGNWETAERLSDGTYLTDSERDILPNNESEEK